MSRIPTNVRFAAAGYVISFYAILGAVAVLSMVWPPRQQSKRIVHDGWIVFELDGAKVFSKVPHCADHAK